jgi:hypothetical protein
MVGGFARIANRVTRPQHSTFPAGSGARAHGLRAKAGAPFLSFFLSNANSPTETMRQEHLLAPIIHLLLPSRFSMQQGRLRQNMLLLAVILDATTL